MFLSLNLVEYYYKFRLSFFIYKVDAAIMANVKTKSTLSTNIMHGPIHRVIE